MANREQNEVISQQDLCKYLIEKLSNINNIIIKTNPFTNSNGICYGINVKAHSLSHIGNSVFYSLSLKTVSHKSRIIYIKLVFNDDDIRNTVMKVNADTINQIFREIANTTKENGEENKTLESVCIKEFTDNKQNKHLSVIGESTKGASLYYTYLRTMEFVHIINEKYGNSNTDADTNADANDIDINNNNSNFNIYTELNENTNNSNNFKLFEKQQKALEELRNAQNAVINDAINADINLQTLQYTQSITKKYKVQCSNWK